MNKYDFQCTNTTKMFLKKLRVRENKYLITLEKIIPFSISLQLHQQSSIYSVHLWIVFLLHFSISLSRQSRFQIIITPSHVQRRINRTNDDDEKWERVERERFDYFKSPYPISNNIAIAFFSIQLKLSYTRIITNKNKQPEQSDMKKEKKRPEIYSYKLNREEKKSHRDFESLFKSWVRSFVVWRQFRAQFFFFLLYKI